MKFPWLAALLLAASLTCGLRAGAAPRPVIVISDIDDTIKDTGVVREIPGATPSAAYRKDYAHLAGDPFRAWRPVPGMAARYRSWIRGEPVEFVYLSKGPWCYGPHVSRFLRDNRFPDGRVLLNPCFPIAPREYKSAPIRKIIRTHPGSDFVLVGDSGEDDPEIYGRIAARLPGSVRRIFIRDLTPRNLPGRFTTALAGVPRSRWRLFTQASQLPPAPLDRPAKLPLYPCPHIPNASSSNSAPASSPTRAARRWMSASLNDWPGRSPGWCRRATSA